jgi:hypothetical protein
MTVNLTTVKEAAVAELVSRVTAMSDSAPVGDPYGVSFSAVYRDTVTDGLVTGKKAVATILDDTETKKDHNYGRTDCRLLVYIEMHVMRDTGQVSSTNINNYTGAVERMLRADRTLGNKIAEINFLGTEVTTQGPFTNYASGVMKVELIYRHHTDDPRVAA